MAKADFVPRAAATILDEILVTMPVAVVTGARQTGKSTFLMQQPTLDSHVSYTMDDVATRAEAAQDPSRFVARDPMMIIDEVQRAPELMLAVKAAVDREGQQTTGRFVLTGSANLLMMKQVADSLAGRAAYLRLGPLTRAEQAGQARTGRWEELFEHRPANWKEMLLSGDNRSEDWRVATARGGLPVPALRLEARARARWFADYVTTYVERDLRDLSAVELLGDFQRTMKSLALRLGNPLNQTEIARDLGVQQRNISRWISLLETSWLVTLLPTYSVNRTSRLMKRPKVYWTDSALAMHVAGETEPRGAHFENLVLADLQAWAALRAPRPEIMYWRTVDNAEVDFVVELGNRLLAIEVKAAARPGVTDWAHLRRFVAEYGDACHGALLLHGGTETFEASDRVVVAPWWRVL